MAYSDRPSRPTSSTHGSANHACPQFEELSEFIDRELDADRSAHVATHLTSCATCRELTTAAALVADTSTIASWHGSMCAVGTSPEQLVAYLAANLPETEDRAIEAHLADCEACVHTLAIMQSHARAVAELTASTPAAASDRRVELPRVNVAKSDRALRVAVHNRWFLRLPVQMPAAFAAGALLMLAAHQIWPGASTPSVMTRSITAPRTARVTALQVPLRAEPHAHAMTVATLHRGMVVEVIGEDREWFHVRLPDGGDGWAEPRAFE